MSEAPYRHVLVTLDCTAADAAILEHIRGLARLCSARLTLLHVADGFAARYQKDLGESEEMRRDADYLAARRVELAGEGFEVEAVLACGEPADEILRIAEAEGCDLIAMSTHGHRGILDFILGSAATSVRHRAQVPVLLVRARK